MNPHRNSPHHASQETHSPRSSQHTVPRRPLCRGLAAGASRPPPARWSSATGDSSCPVPPGTTLRYFTFIAAPDHLKDLDKIVAAFEKANPNIKVKVETAAYDDYFTKLQTTIAGGTAPDTFELDYENFVTYAGSGTLLDLPGGRDDPPTTPPSRSTTFKLDGKQYGLPESFSDVVLIYNKDLFDKAGVAAPDRRLDLGGRAGRRAEADRQGQGRLRRLPAGQFYEYYKAVQQAGGKFLAADGKRRRSTTAAGTRRRDMAGRQGRQDDADGGRAAAPPTTTPTCSRPASSPCGTTGIWQFAGLNGRPSSAGTSSSSRATARRPARCSRTRRRLCGHAAPGGGRQVVGVPRLLRRDGRHQAGQLWSSRRSPTPPSCSRTSQSRLPRTSRPCSTAWTPSRSSRSSPTSRPWSTRSTRRSSNAAAGRKPVQQALDDAAAAVNELIG